MTAALEGCEWSAARPGRTLPPGNIRYPLYRRLGGRKNSSSPGFILNIYCTLNHIHRNLTSLLPRVLVVRFPYHTVQHSHLQSFTPAVWGFPLPTPCPILTKVCSFLGFSPRERALSRVPIHSFLPALSG